MELKKAGFNVPEPKYDLPKQGYPQTGPNPTTGNAASTAIDLDEDDKKDNKKLFPGEIDFVNKPLNYDWILD